MVPFVVLMLFIAILIILANKKVFLLDMATQKMYIKEKKIWTVEIEFF